MTSSTSFPPGGVNVDPEFVYDELLAAPHTCPGLIYYI
jgi:hypothetical protein